MRRFRPNYSKLWVKNSDQKPKLSIKELLNDLDVNSDLATSSSDYSQVMIEGMIKLLSRNLTRKELIENEKFFEKLMDLGRSIMNGSRDSAQLFTLGMLIETKIRKNFMSLKFYKIISESLNYIKSNVKIFSQVFIKKLKTEFNTHLNSLNIDMFYHYKECA